MIVRDEKAPQQNSSVFNNAADIMLQLAVLKITNTIIHNLWVICL